MPHENFLNFLFCLLVLEILESSKNVASFYGDEKVFVVNFFFFLYFILIVPESPISHY